MAVIRDGNGRVLVSRRPHHVEQGGLWEFPGGKLLAGETPLVGLTRELEEELGITLKSAIPLIKIRHSYVERTVLLDVWEVWAWNGKPYGREAQEVTWLRDDVLRELDFPAANAPIITALGLPRICLITPEPYAKRLFLDDLELSLQHGVSLVQLRAKNLSYAAYRDIARDALKICRAHRVRLIINSAIEIAREIGADGVHLTADDLQRHAVRPLPPSNLISAACHRAADLARAESLGVDFALLSPVKPTLTHPHAQALGWSQTKKLVATTKLPVFALGGMDPTDVVEAVSNNCIGIAGIRGLWRSTHDMSTNNVRELLLKEKDRFDLEQCA
ncbi:MAG: Nudix family hydrolase [Gammaproteobacteria bacterium]|nr:Nudix family hydrolase [Gammaproteobacteria bacterium]